MSFQTHLESVVSQVDGALACSVMGFDGITVESHQVPGADELDLTAALIEFTNVLSQLKGAAELLKTGGVQEVSINTDKVLTLMRLITPEYFVVLALKPDGNYGKGRYVLRITAPKLKSEL
jgi:predicted regulator of Ras-like GTPase activity (Roadblock/LC7/MglB family)